MGTDANGNVYMAGTKNQGDKYLLVKVDPQGNHLWDREYSNSSSHVTRDVEVTTSGDIYLAGNAPGNFDLIKYDSAGNIKWQTNFSFIPSFVISSAENIYLRASKDEKYLYCAYSNKSNTINTNAVVVKFDSSGTALGYFVYDSAGVKEDVYGFEIDTTGAMYVMAQSQGGVLLFKLEQLNPVGLKENMLQPVPATVYPNPAKDEADFYFSNLTAANKNELLLYDIAGRELQRYSVTGSMLKADLSFLKPGMYFYTVAVNGKNSGAGKVVVQR